MEHLHQELQANGTNVGAHIGETLVIFDFTSQRTIGELPDIPYTFLIFPALTLKLHLYNLLPLAYIVIKFSVIKASAC